MREVSMCSTIHKPLMEMLSPETCTTRKLRGGRKKASQHLAVGLWVEVDLSGQLLQYYSMHKRSNRWYRTLLYHFIDIVATNSYILYKEMCQTSDTVPMSHSQFMEELSAVLCGVPKGSDVPPRAPQCLPESLACVDDDDDGEEEKGGSSNLRDGGQQPQQQRGTGTACSARRALFGSVHSVMWHCVLSPIETASVIGIAAGDHKVAHKTSGLSLRNAVWLLYYVNTYIV